MIDLLLPLLLRLLGVIEIDIVVHDLHRRVSRVGRVSVSRWRDRPQATCGESDVSVLPARKR